MISINALKTMIGSRAGRGVLVLAKKSPTIFVAAGVVGVVGTVVLACKATLKVYDVLSDAADKAQKVEEAQRTLSKEKYSDSDADKDFLIIKIQTGLAFVKLYGPSIILGTISIGLILKSHNILSKRNVSLMAAYKCIEESFASYRKRVVDEFGADKDRCLKNGVIRKTIETIDENGNITQNTVQSVDLNGISQYARFFDEASTQWTKSSEYNMTFIQVQQNYANDLLKARGHVFLNEVYDMIGVPRSQAGAIVGWAKGEGDDFVDFGIFDGESMAARDFVNGYERSILLDFNVSGVIYDMI